MGIKFSNIVNKTDWVKIIILLIISVACWAWVWHEYQKPILPPDWDQITKNR
jgi:lipoprotein signal peptidase